MSTINRHIPGTIKVEGREHLYISDDGEVFCKKKVAELLRSNHYLIKRLLYLK